MEIDKWTFRYLSYLTIFNKGRSPRCRAQVGAVDGRRKTTPAAGQRWKKPLVVWGERALDVSRWRLLARARSKNNGDGYDRIIDGLSHDERREWRTHTDRLKQDGSDSEEDDDADADNAESVDTFNFVRIRADAAFEEDCVHYTRPQSLYTTLIRNRLHLEDLAEEDDDETDQVKLLRHPWAQFLARFRKKSDKDDNDDRARILSECMADDDQRLIFSESESVTFIYRNVEEPYVCMRKVMLNAADTVTNFMIHAISEAVRDEQMSKLKSVVRAQSAHGTRCDESIPTDITAAASGEHPWLAFLAFVCSNSFDKLFKPDTLVRHQSANFIVWGKATEECNSVRLVPGDRITGPVVRLRYVTRRTNDGHCTRHNERYYLYASAPSRRAQQLRRLCARMLSLKTTRLAIPSTEAAPAAAAAAADDVSIDGEEGGGDDGADNAMDAKEATETKKEEEDKKSTDGDEGGAGVQWTPILRPRKKKRLATMSMRQTRRK